MSYWIYLSTNFWPTWNPIFSSFKLTISSDPLWLPLLLVVERARVFIISKSKKSKHDSLTSRLMGVVVVIFERAKKANFFFFNLCQHFTHTWLNIKKMVEVVRSSKYPKHFLDLRNILFIFLESQKRGTFSSSPFNTNLIFLKFWVISFSSLKLWFFLWI